MADASIVLVKEDGTKIPVKYRDIGGGVYALATVGVDAAGAPVQSAARLAADNLALPTAPDVLAVLLGYDGTNLDLVRVIVGGGAPVSASGGLLASAPVVYDGAQSRHIVSARQLSDGVTLADTPGAGVMVFNGTTWNPQRTPNVFKPLALGAGTTETTIWTPAAGKKFRLMGFLLTCGAASTLAFKDNTAGATIFAARGATDTPISPSGMGNGILSAAANNVLTVTRGTSCTLDGVVWGTEE